MGKQNRGVVSIHPASFADTAENCLYDKLEFEKKRTKSFPQDDPLVRVHFTWLHPSVEAGVKGLAKGRATRDLVTQTIVDLGIKRAEEVPDLLAINEAAKYITDVYNEFGGVELLGLTQEVSRQCSPFRDYVIPSDKIAMAESYAKRLSSLTAGTGLARYELASFVYLLVLSVAESPALFGVAKDAEKKVGSYIRYFSRRLIIMGAYKQLAEDIVKNGSI